MAKLSGCLALLFVMCLHIVRGARLEINNYAGGVFFGSGPEVDKKMGFISNTECNSLEPESLAEILGPAYNPRYMSVIPPAETQTESVQQMDMPERKRGASQYNEFFVDDDFTQELGNIPAWEINYVSNIIGNPFQNRKKRSSGGSRPWECKSIVRWIDLGSDYYPRYLRTVECTKHSCWYGKFTCKARSFTVKLLRRKQGKCVYHHYKEGEVGLPQELRELWVWEERAVNFCCDCAMA